MPCKSRHAEPGEKEVAFSVLSIKAYRNEKALRLFNLRFSVGNSRGILGIYSNYGAFSFELLYTRIAIT